jgi:hypothetical protein
VQASAETVAVNGWPAIVAVRDCGAVLLFGSAVSVTDPLPDPDAGEGTRPAVPVAVQAAGAHPAGVVVTFTTCEPPVDAKLAVAGEIANEQAEGVGVGVGVGCVTDGVLAVPLHESSVARRAPAANERKSWSRMRIFYRTMRVGISRGSRVITSPALSRSSWMNASGVFTRSFSSKP